MSTKCSSFVVALMVAAGFLHASTAFVKRAEPIPRESSGRFTDPIRTSSGLVRGMRENVLGTPVDLFLGIPYAKPPLDNLRFRKPVPVDPWGDSKVFEANKKPNTCVQERTEVFGPGFRGEEMWNPNTPVSEDCLYVNLWIPAGRKRNSEPMTTLIWIYGGGFTSGSSALDVYDGRILAATKGVIVASLNYRLGPFGFLYQGTEEAPGNVGMYDQILAIQWIKDNIRAFGGDPDLVTYFGESAGAASISLLLLSPASRSLSIRRVVLQSGSANVPWGYQTAQQSKEVAKALMEDVGCANASIPMDCMRKVAAGKLSVAQWNRPIMMFFPIGPTIDGAFLPKHPNEILKEGSSLPKMDMMVGTNRDEGTYFLLYDFLGDFNKDTPSVLSRERFLGIINAFFNGSTTPLEREAIAFHYTDWAEEAKGAGPLANEKRLGKLFGDYHITCPVNRFAETFAEHGSNVYYYHFTQRTNSNPWGKWMGVLHGDEIEYVFGLPLNSTLGYTQCEQGLSKRIMGHWVTFAKTGKPDEGGSWPKYTGKDPRYLILNSEGSGGRTVGQGMRSTSCAFWNQFMPVLKQQCQI